MSQPPNSISRAPSAACRSASGVVVRLCRESGVASTRGFGHEPAPDRAAGSTELRRPGDEGPLGLEGQRGRRLVEPDPADLARTRGRGGRGRRRSAPSGSSGRSCGSACPPGRSSTRSSRGARDPDLEPGLLGDLAQGGLLGGLAAVRRALREGPGPTVPLATATADDERWLTVFMADDDPAGGRGGRGPQARHGAEAALGRRVAAAVPGSGPAS